ncbi:TonB family protein [Pandoraea apista]|uniref:TonB family protein n=1 Tax=Pandoraea apista TaxID=93218 RepID=UPI00248DA9DC|nr:TonB family protein [Pandoraea apista]
MTADRASTSWLALAGCSIFLALTSAISPVRANPAIGQVAPVQETEARIDFDIPALALTDALQRYGATARQPALYRSEILAGQISTAVQGRYSPEAALHKLLEGTGLTAEKFNMGQSSAFILKSASDSAAVPSPNGLGNLTGYPGFVQARVWQALCGNPLTVPGRYRAVLRFELDASGHIQHPRLIGSTGDRRRDIAVLETLRDLHMDAAPPKDIAQPVTMLLLPRDAEFGMSCDADPAARAGS